MIEEPVYPDEFEAFLDTTEGELEIAGYLKARPWVLYWSLCRAGGHARYVLNEFKLGNQFTVDTLILNSYSGVWEAIFVELESVTDPVFTKRRTPTQCLAQAIKQCDDWAEFAEQNRDLLRRDFVRCAKRFDKLGYTSQREPSNYTGDLLADPSSFLQFRYVIVIGRSTRMSPETRALMGRVGARHSVDVVSYDRLLRLAQARYGDDKSLWNEYPRVE